MDDYLEKRLLITGSSKWLRKLGDKKNQLIFPLSSLLQRIYLTVTSGLIMEATEEESGIFLLILCISRF